MNKPSRFILRHVYPVTWFDGVYPVAWVDSAHHGDGTTIAAGLTTATELKMTIFSLCSA